MDVLKDAAEEMDKVITISQNGLAALSDNDTNLARVNAQAKPLRSFCWPSMNSFLNVASLSLVSFAI